MSLGEFSLIQHYFADHSTSANDHPAVLGIGDDAAVLEVPAGYHLVQTIDTLIAGTHFPLQTDAADMGYKSLAVNVSDLVAMAAEPAWFVLSLTLPDSDEIFLRDFCHGLFAAAEDFEIQLVGGDTCKGNLSITIQASGLVPQNKFVTRSGAGKGDRIYVSGSVGAAATALAGLQDRIKLNATQLEHCLPALNRPRPPLELIPVIRQYASSAIDISDGLAADLGHILQKSRVGATIDKDLLPVFEWIKKNDKYDLALFGGDDYQVIFTVPESSVMPMLALSESSTVKLTEIGVITAEGFRLKDGEQLIDISTRKGFDHFGE